MSAHIIGRPDDDILEILLGDGAEPEQAIFGRGYYAEFQARQGRRGHDSRPDCEPTGGAT